MSLGVIPACCQGEQLSRSKALFAASKTAGIGLECVVLCTFAMIFRIAEDHGEDVVKVVRNAARELSDGFEFLGLTAVWSSLIRSSLFEKSCKMPITIVFLSTRQWLCKISLPSSLANSDSKGVVLLPF